VIEFLMVGITPNPFIMKTILNNQISEIKVSYFSKVKPSERIKINCSKDAHQLFRKIWSNQMEIREEFLMLLLNRNNQVLGWHVVSLGGASGTVVDPKIIFSIALKCLAHGIIICHNHSSGNLNPSETDKALTKKIRLAGQFLDITILDHLIITKEGYFSFTDQD
jgi:DNA repair protein RadC